MLCREPEVIFLLGTAHVSRLSAQDVDRLVTTIRPDVVSVELCRSRKFFMYPLDDDGRDELVGEAVSSPGGAPVLVHYCLVMPLIACPHVYSSE